MIISDSACMKKAEIAKTVDKSPFLLITCGRRRRISPRFRPCPLSASSPFLPPSANIHIYIGNWRVWRAAFGKINSFNQFGCQKMNFVWRDTSFCFRNHIKPTFFLQEAYFLLVKGLFSHIRMCTFCSRLISSDKTAVAWHIGCVR